MKRNWWKYLIWLVVAFYIYTIFRNSMMIADASNEMSYALTYKLIDFLSRFHITVEFHSFHHYVRKMAHFCEFAGLGFLVGLANHIAPFFRSRLLNFCLFLFLVPFTDEMLQQFFDGRSTQFSDMLIDGAGILFGGFVIYVIILICKDLFHLKQS